MNIWIINHHALTPDMSGGTRHYDFAKELVRRGHEVTIVASSFHYLKYVDLKSYKDKFYLREKIDGVDFIWFKTYPYKSNSLKRVINMLDFTQKVLRYIPKMNMKKPDIIIGSSVHLFAVFAGYRLSLNYDTPFIMEVRDLWPQTLIDLGMSKWHPFVLFLGFLERFLYKKADKIISNLPYAYEYIGKYVPKDKFIWISNGVDLENAIYTPREKEDKFVISYTGAIGLANNLELLVEVANEIREFKDIYIQIIGEGTQKNKLQEMIKKYNLKNISIKKLLPKHEIYRVLSGSDVLYFNLKDSPVFRYGISSNKLFDYMASGRIIIFSTNSKNNPIKDANEGYTIEPDSVEILRDTILKIYNLPFEERVNIGKNIRKYAVKHYSINTLTDKLEQCLHEQFTKKKVKI